MSLALAEAALAPEHGDVPVGAVIVIGGDVLARAHNEREKRNDPTAHAEILALQEAAAQIGQWRLEGADMYVTLEPCPMCAGALVLARLRSVFYGASDPRAGAALSLYNIPQDPRLNHNLEVTAGVMAGEAARLLTGFFNDKRT